jgi:hypothetical protein
VEAVDELERERDQQRDPQQHEGADGQGLLARNAHVARDAERGVSKPGREHQQEHHGAGEVWLFVQMGARRRTVRQRPGQGHV